MDAWIITWEGASPREVMEDKVVNFLSPEKTPSEVAEVVQMLYAQFTSTLGELARYAADPGSVPYKSTMNPTKAGYYRVACGHNPWLEARLVKELSVRMDEDTLLETVSWKEQMASGEWAEETYTRTRTVTLSFSEIAEEDE